MSNTTSINKLPVAASGPHAWSLDFPQNGKAPRVSERGLYLQGWLLARADAAPGEVVLRYAAGGEDVVRPVPFNTNRPDVIQRVLGADPTGHAQLRCGFIAHVKEVAQSFTLGLKQGDDTVWLCEVQLDGDVLATQVENKPAEMHVIRGTAGWLFLDNDTNRSVDQYTGRLLLDSAGLARWQAYLDECAAIAADVGARHALLIAASKEQVLPEHYPHAKGEITVHEQVLGLCRDEHRVLDTVQLLRARADREACFIKTDTHWTDRGAMIAALALVESLGMDQQAAVMRLEQDVYHTMPFAGDLGTKLVPPQSEPTEFLRAPSAVTGAVFDNHLPNIGRVLVFENDQALWPLRLLVFGASSSYPMLKYLKRLFGRVVFIHSAGNVDSAIVRHERPDCLVLQTTARFMIEPPGTAFHLADAVQAKMSAATDAAKARAAASAEEAARNPHNLPYLIDLERTE